MESTSSARRVRFGQFEIDGKTGELRKDGTKIRLQEQPLQILQILLEHPGEIVARDELRKRVWPTDTFVDFDHGINNAIKRLRESLGDTAETPRFVETQAAIYGALREYHKAFDCLEAAYYEHSPWMPYVRVASFFDDLRADSRFGDLVQRMNFP